MEIKEEHDIGRKNSGHDESDQSGDQGHGGQVWIDGRRCDESHSGVESLNAGRSARKGCARGRSATSLRIGIDRGSAGLRSRRL